jgi:hypothetical protein
MHFIDAQEYGVHTMSLLSVFIVHQWWPECKQNIAIYLFIYPEFIKDLHVQTLSSPLGIYW